MSRSLSCPRALFLIASISLGSALAHAQFRASLRGTVTDSQGAVVPSATVTLTNTVTNQKIVAISDENGVYQFNALVPAPYALTAEHAGFTKKALDYVQIIPEQLNSLDLQLESGEAQQSDSAHAVVQSRRHSMAQLAPGIVQGCVARRPGKAVPAFR